VNLNTEASQQNKSTKSVVDEFQHKVKGSTIGQTIEALTKRSIQEPQGRCTEDTHPELSKNSIDQEEGKHRTTANKHPQGATPSQESMVKLRNEPIVTAIATHHSGDASISQAEYSAGQNVDRFPDFLGGYSGIGSRHTQEQPNRVQIMSFSTTLLMKRQMKQK